MTAARLCSALLGATALLAGQLGAQEPVPGADSAATIAARTVTLVGVVRDTAGLPLSGAEVRAGARQFTLTGEDGRFALTGVAPDTIQLLVRRIGYQPADVILEAGAGLRVELAVKLVPSATELGTIVVNGRKMDTRLLESGFYDRQKVGSGTFFDPDDLEHHGGSMDALLREVPSVRVSRDIHNRSVALGQFAGGTCRLNVFLDGILIRWAADEGLDMMVNKRDVLAIEVYPRPVQVPAIFAGYLSESQGGLPLPGGGASGGGGASCGALVIWTKPVGSDEIRARR
ncbi:MAG TPA: carboxypeptidase-like regulatory domain-containing protein [Gemmatimonadaceae bacterium]|nr:carboxypeptidase-like regulatory domain-containing protein [Gemmatimonadaceae bacterium]